MAVTMLALCAGRVLLFYVSGTNFCYRLGNPQGQEQREDLVTSSGLETVNCRLVGHYLDQTRYRVQHTVM
jgi:hypothetical protein